MTPPRLLFLMILLVQGCSWLPIQQTPEPEPDPAPPTPELIQRFERQIAVELFERLDAATAVSERDLITEQLTRLNPALLAPAQRHRIKLLALSQKEKLAIGKLDFLRSGSAPDRASGALFVEYLTGFSFEEARQLLNQEMERLKSAPTASSSSNKLAPQLALSLMSLAVSDIYPVVESWFPRMALTELSIVASNADQGASELPVSYDRGVISVDLDQIVQLPAFELPHLGYAAGVPGQHLLGGSNTTLRSNAFRLGWGVYAAGLIVRDTSLTDPLTRAGYLNHRRLYLALARADLAFLEGEQAAEDLDLPPYPKAYADRYKAWQKSNPGLALTSMLTVLALEALVPDALVPTQKDLSRLRAFHQRVLEQAPLQAKEMSEKLKLSEVVDPTGS